MDSTKLFIGGEWIKPSTDELIDDLNPASETVLARFPAGRGEDVNRAVSAAKEAFSSWSGSTLGQRCTILRALSERLRDRQHDLAELVAREVGTPLAKSLAVQTRSAVAVAEAMADVLEGFEFEEEIGHSLVWREPIGVVACITPWNYPLHQVVAKVAPALAAGCTVVLKPSELAPLTAFALAEIFNEIGLPSGVFNLVTGSGPCAGEPLVTHPDVDMVSFTGSTGAGRRVAALAADSVKRVSQELGGKSANLILDDADMRKAVRVGVNQCFLNSGQTCFAWSRMLVHVDQYEEAVTRATKLAETFDCGDPVESRAKLGPLISGDQRRRVRQAISQAISDGARLQVGGGEAPLGLERGYYVRPTVFSDVDPAMAIAQEEVFGPVLAILPYRDLDEAVAIANGTRFGLAGAVWSEDPKRALAVARLLRCGQVDVNGGGFNPAAPFGGYRQSGNGRELGRYGLEEFLEVK